MLENIVQHVAVRIPRNDDDGQLRRGRKSVWYQAKSTDYDTRSGKLIRIDKQAELLAFCKRTWGTTDAEIKTITDAQDFAITQAGERGMEEACGIA